MTFSIFQCESYFSEDQEAAVGLLPLRGLGATEGPVEISKRLCVRALATQQETEQAFLEQ